MTVRNIRPTPARRPVEETAELVCRDETGAPVDLSAAIWAAFAGTAAPGWTVTLERTEPAASRAAS